MDIAHLSMFAYDGFSFNGNGLSLSNGTTRAPTTTETASSVVLTPGLIYNFSLLYVNYTTETTSTIQLLWWRSGGQLELVPVEAIHARGRRDYYSFGGAMVAMRTAATATLTYLHGDHLGSTSLTTNASGQKVSEQRYKPYGEVRWSSGAGMPTDFTFTAQRAGPANYVGSLMDYVARGYSPALGRFISADTIVPGAGNPQAFNRYMYVRGSPLGRIDPSGHDDDRPEDFFFNLIGGFLGGLAEANGATTFSGFERSLDVQSRDSTVHDVGRFAGNVAGVYQGLVEIAGGISGGAAGALLGCGTTVCLASPAAVALGGTITLHGAAVAGAGMQFAAKRISSRVSQQAESKQDLSKARKPYEVSKEGSDRIAKNDRFGTFFRNKNTGQWWSKDIDGHGGSVWKVFKEGSKGLTWYKDADIYGDFIEAKYKGDVGRFISWDDLKIITTP